MTEAAPFNILVVCIGNVCRSPLAATRLRDHLGGVGILDSLLVTSAGTAALAGQSMEPTAASELRRLGGRPDGFRATQLTEAHLEAADLVLAATRGVRRDCLRLAPRALRRSFTLTEFAVTATHVSQSLGRSSLTELAAGVAAARGAVAVDQPDVADPMGRGPAAHRRAADEIDRACSKIAHSIQLTLPATGAEDARALLAGDLNDR